jgi:Tol biopolymer transport system component
MHWSPDGRQLLVVRAHDGYDGGHQVGLLDPATGNIQRIGSVTDGTISAAVWLPAD